MPTSPTSWEDMLPSSNALPVVVKSFQKLMDSHYQVEAASSHNEFELIYVQTANSAHLEVGNETVPLMSRDLILMKPHQPHKIDVSSDQICQLLVLKFTFGKNDQSIVSPISTEDFLDFISGHESGGYIRLVSRFREEIATLMGKIMEESRQSDEHSEFISSLMVMEIFVWLSRSLRTEWEQSMNQKGDRLRKLMDTAKEYIETNYMLDIGLNDVAHYIYLSTSHFAREFKKTFGVSPIQYLLSLRVKQAANLLETTNKRIGDIATEVGFQTQQRFNDIFKKQIHMSPSEYRNEYKKKMVNR